MICCLMIYFYYYSLLTPPYYRARICRPYMSPGIDSQHGGLLRQPYLSYWPARLHRLAKSIPRNRFLGSIKVYKYGLRLLSRPASVWRHRWAKRSWFPSTALIRTKKGRSQDRKTNWSEKNNKLKTISLAHYREKDAWPLRLFSNICEKWKCWLMPKNQSKILQCSRRFSSFIFVKADFARLREVAKIFKTAFSFNSE